MSGTGPGQSVSGYLGPTSFNPLAGYPTDPSVLPGFNARDEGFAGVIHGRPSDGGPDLNLYCIDLLTNTYPGIGYLLGGWNEADVPNVGYVARLLNDYYPTTDQPASLTDLNQKAAAVQAAIWFFSDRYVLSAGGALHAPVAAIVAAVIAAGPLVEPPPPSLTITPSTATAPAGGTAGPYIVNTGSSLVTAAVSASGASMFADPGATQPISNGTHVPDAQFIYLRSVAPGTATLQATATTTVPTGNVYLYDGNTPGVSDAQKLILAQEATLQTTVHAQATFEAPGSLTVTKVITGPGAGQQGPITITVTCNGTVLQPVFTIPVGATGSPSHTYADIPAGSVCSVVEDPDGHTGTLTVTKPASGIEVTIPAGGNATATITDTYESPPGDLVVNKTITGPAAGHQAAIGISVVCGTTTLAPFDIPGGAPAGTVQHRYTAIPAGSACTITETSDGHTPTVSVVTVGSGQQVTTPSGGAATADLTDTYDYVPGSIILHKTITGPLAGHQGPITIRGECNGIPLPPLLIPAGAPAGTITRVYAGLPAGAVCTGTENPNGATTTVTATVTATPLPVTVPAGAPIPVTVTDTYTVTDSALRIQKTIAGPAAGQQGPITISPTCGIQALPAWTIPAGTAAGTLAHTYSNLTPGQQCTVVETSDGHTSTTSAVTTTSGLPVTLPVNGTITVDLTDSYTAVLPNTGTPTRTMLTTAGALLLVGAFLLIAAGRRRQV